MESTEKKDEQIIENNSKEGDCSEKEMTNCKPAGEKMRTNILLGYSLFILFSSFFFNTPSEIFRGMQKILVDTSLLISDYIAIGNIGAAMFNAGALMVLMTLLAKASKVPVTGGIYAAVFTAGGFALFGKNLYNVWSIILGVYIFAKIKRESFGSFILVAIFGTALAPLVSQITFGMSEVSIMSGILGNLGGVAVGLLLVPIARHGVNFHKGYNLYNMGFTCGIIGTIFMMVLRAFDLGHSTKMVISEGNNQILGIWLLIIFASLFLLGFILNKNSLRCYPQFLRESGRLYSDFINMEGFSVVLVNMGTLGFVSTGYVLLVKGQLSGPVIGGILTVVGFGSFGKHLMNILPIMIGVFLGTKLMMWDTFAVGALLAALFGTTLAPTAGKFGWLAGIVAGFLHLAMVMNLGFMHGGMNLYNNGFSGGLIAGIMVPVIEAYQRNGTTDCSE